MGDKMKLHRVEAAYKEVASVRSSRNYGAASLLSFVDAD